MKNRVRMQAKGQITMPASIRRTLPENASFDVEVLESGDIVLHLVHTIEIRADQAWFWGNAWQSKEREVDRHLAAGEVKTYESGDDFLDSLAT